MGRHVFLRLKRAVKIISWSALISESDFSFPTQLKIFTANFSFCRCLDLFRQDYERSSVMGWATVDVGIHKVWTIHVLRNRSRSKERQNCAKHNRRVEHTYWKSNINPTGSIISKELTRVRNKKLLREFGNLISTNQLHYVCMRGSLRVWQIARRTTSCGSSSGSWIGIQFGKSMRKSSVVRRCSKKNRIAFGR